MADVNSELIALSRSLRSLVNAQAQAAQATERNSLAQGDAARRETAAVERHTESIVKGRKLNEKQLELLSKVERAKAEEFKLTEKIRKQRATIADAEKRGAAGAEAAAAAREDLTDLERKHGKATKELNKTSGELDRSFRGLLKGVDFAGVALTWFGAALRGQAQQLVDQYKTAGGVIEGTENLIGSLMESQNTARKYGLTGNELMEISTASRQTVNAMGGTEQAFKMMSPMIDKFRIMTGNSVEAAKMAAKAAEHFTAAGIKPTVAGMELYRKSIVDLRAQTGMTNEQAQQYYADIASDADSIDMLRSARAGEREAILASQRALVKQAIASGMSAEQAKEAAKMLNKMVAAKPLDRIKQAAKVRALGGALGIGGANEAAEGVIAGKRATDAQKQAMQQFNTNAANKMDQMAAQGLGQEIFATTLLDKLDLEQYYGKGSAFSTSLGDALKPLEGVMQKYIDAASTSQGETLGNAIWAKDIAGNILKGNDFLGVITAGIAAIIALMLKGNIASVLKKGLDKLTPGKTAAKAVSGADAASKVADKAGKVAETAGKAADAAGKAADAAAKVKPVMTIAENAGKAAEVAGTATKTVETAGKATSLAAKAGSALKAVGKFAGIGGAVLDAGLGVNDLINGQKQTEMKGWDYASPMRYGMRTGEAVNQGVEKLTGGKSIGSGMYDMFNEDKVSKMLTTPVAPKTTKTKDTLSDASQATADASKDIKQATQTTADGVTAQVKKMDASNDLLKRLAETSDKQTELLEKQLVALTMTDTEKQDGRTTRDIRRDNKFAAQYNYV